jgi:uncharacterized protein Veg
MLTHIDLFSQIQQDQSAPKARIARMKKISITVTSALCLVFVVLIGAQTYLQSEIDLGHTQIDMLETQIKAQVGHQIKMTTIDGRLQKVATTKKGDIQYVEAYKKLSTILEASQAPFFIASYKVSDKNVFTAIVRFETQNDLTKILHYLEKDTIKGVKKLSVEGFVLETATRTEPTQKTITITGTFL